MTDAHITLIDGAPGAGKTHTLREKLENEASQGLDLGDFYWLNFSNAGRLDVEPEIADVYAAAADDRYDPEDRAKTLHGLALSLCIQRDMINGGSAPEQIIVQGRYLTDDELDEFDPHADFARRHGMRYDAQAADPKKLLSGEDGGGEKVGNKLFAINDFLTQTCKPAEKWHHAGIDMHMGSSSVESLLEAWNEYKKDPPVAALDRRLFEHGDYVALAYEARLTPNIEVLFIDEFQDLAPAEYRLYKLWRDVGPVESMYIAGDENQSLYGFRGGTPVYFQGTDIDERIDLKKSYRCPENIAAVGNSILSVHPDTDPRGFEGIDSGGRVRWSDVRTKETLREALIDSTEGYDDEPSAMLLTRTNHQLRELTRDLRNVGIPFEVLGTAGSVWGDDEMGELLGVLSALSDDADTFALGPVRTLLEHLPDSEQRRKSRGQGFSRFISDDNLAPALSDYDSAGEVIDDLQVPAWKREALNSAVESPAGIEPDELKVGTMHTAKGLEAPAVYLFTESTESLTRKYQFSNDTAAEEHRAYYVGATRASEELNMVNNYFDSPLAPPVKKVRQMGVAQ